MSQEMVTLVFEALEKSIEIPLKEAQKVSLLDIALDHGVEIDHACGGVCACSTCHIKIVEGAQQCNEPSEEEEDQLDEAPGLSTQSRLACQCFVQKSGVVKIQIPEWNRNIVQEGH